MKNKIAEYRKPLGLSQHRLGKKVGLTRQSIMAYENDTKEPTVKIAFAISHALGKKIDEVFIYDHTDEQR